MGVNQSWIVPSGIVAPGNFVSYRNAVVRSASYVFVLFKDALDRPACTKFALNARGC